MLYLLVYDEPLVRSHLVLAHRESHTIGKRIYPGVTQSIARRRGWVLLWVFLYI